MDAKKLDDMDEITSCIDADNSEKLLTELWRNDVITERDVAALFLQVMNWSDFNADEFTDEITSGTHSHLQQKFFDAVIKETIKEYSDMDQFVDPRNNRAVTASEDITQELDW
jgi:hypothetical protein